jgi:hypothetical protein
MKLRYFTIQNKINAEVVRAYAHENQLPTMEAKRLLEEKSATVLQYWDGHAEQWITVPYVTEFRE